MLYFKIRTPKKTGGEQTMLYEKIHEQNSILGSALQAASLRNEVITNNIANDDVPRYKAKTVYFEDSLIRALDARKRTGRLDLSDARPSVRFVNQEYSYRIDSNNVDIELEMVSLYQNSIKYDAMINSVTNNSKRLNLVLNGR